MMAARLLLAVVVAGWTAMATPDVVLYPQYNQALNVLVPGGTSKGGTVVSLGASPSVTDCQAKCLSHAQRCNSFIHVDTQFAVSSTGRSATVTRDGERHRLTGTKDELRRECGGKCYMAGDVKLVPTAGECFAVLSPGFNPSYDVTAVSGVIDWPCRNNDDCSLNGKCVAGVCQCRKAWKGKRCETLNILPATRGAGYRGVDNGHNTSSWGGAVLKGEDGLYHMWAAEITEHCGIGAWAQNSRVIHAVSATPGGRYERTQVVWEVFSHEPEVVPGPNGEYVMYFTADLRSPHGSCNCCRPGTPCDGSTGPGDCSGSSALRDSDGTFMSYATSVNSTSWTKPVPIFPSYHGSDTNFAPIIFTNGSLLAMWRRWEKTGSRMFLATASDWKNLSTYQQHHVELFPDLGTAGTEDQFLYQDDDGYFHAVFHHMYGTGTEGQWWLDATGGHAFSRDGWSWTYTGVAWGNATARYNTPEGQGALVDFDDGTTFRFTRLERPHLIFKSNRLVGDPIFVTNSAQYGFGTNPSVGAKNDDACYTLVRPVNQ